MSTSQDTTKLSATTNLPVTMASSSTNLTTSIGSASADLRVTYPFAVDLSRKMATLIALLQRYLALAEKHHTGMVIWGLMVFIGLKKKIAILLAKKAEAENAIGILLSQKQSLLERVRGLTQEIGQLTNDKKTSLVTGLAVLTKVADLKTKNEGLEKLATKYREKLILKTKENKTNEELVVSLQAQVKLLEEMTASKEKRLELYEK